MTPAEAIELVRGYATAGRWKLTLHADQRARQRGVTRKDLRHALVNASECRHADEPDRWKVSGPDLDGDELTAIVVIENGVIVVTVF